MDIGYVRASTMQPGLDRQLAVLGTEGVPAGLIYVDKRSSAATDRSGLAAALARAGAGDMIKHFNFLDRALLSIALHRPPSAEVPRNRLRRYP